VLIGEELELLKHGYLKCYYVSGYCPTCGCFRVMAALAPDGEWCDCPQCDRAHCNCAVLGSGFTRRLLPEFTIMWPALNLADLPADDPAPISRDDFSLIVSGKGDVLAIARTLNVSKYQARKIQRRAFPGRRAPAKSSPVGGLKQLNLLSGLSV
jgi:hypothetical protein